MNEFYDPVEYILKPAGENMTYPKEDKDQIVQYLGIARNTAEVNAYYVLTQQVRVVTRTDLRPFSMERFLDPVAQNFIDTFNSKIKCLWKLDDEADVKHAAPTFPEFYHDLVPLENDEEIGPMTACLPDPDFSRHRNTISTSQRRSKFLLVTRRSYI